MISRNINAAFCFSFIESHPVLISMIIAVIGAFCLRAYIHRKRADACFGFYANLRLLVETLHNMLENEMMLEDNKLLNSEVFNIFSLHYNEDTLEKKYPGRILVGETYIPNERLEQLREPAAALHDLLQNSENNIFPRKLGATSWYKNQIAISNLCALILGKYNLKINDPASNVPRVLCEKAIAAMDMIVESIEKEQGRFDSPFKRIKRFKDKLLNHQGEKETEEDAE
jgi:hypothetical protein